MANDVAKLPTASYFPTHLTLWVAKIRYLILLGRIINESFQNNTLPELLLLLPSQPRPPPTATAYLYACTVRKTTR